MQGDCYNVNEQLILRIPNFKYCVSPILIEYFYKVLRIVSHGT